MHGLARGMALRGPGQRWGPITAIVRYNWDRQNSLAPPNLPITQKYWSERFSGLHIAALPSPSHFSLEDFGAERRQVCAET